MLVSRNREWNGCNILVANCCNKINSVMSLDNSTCVPGWWCSTTWSLCFWSSVVPSLNPHSCWHDIRGDVTRQALSIQVDLEIFRSQVHNLTNGNLTLSILNELNESTPSEIILNRNWGINPRTFLIKDAPGLIQKVERKVCGDVNDSSDLSHTCSAPAHGRVTAARA